MRQNLCILLAVIAAVAFASACATVRADEMQDRHNAYRGPGRVAYVLDAGLMRDAQAHAERQARSGRMFHSGLRDRAENVAWGQQSVTVVMQDWWHSSGHRANILGPYRAMGWGRSGNFWCVQFR